ncbi:MAG: hypothetical protein SOH48_08660, partial [Eubacteriales bacterium]
QYIKKPAFPQVENAGKSSIFKVFSDFYDSFLTFSCTNHWKLTVKNRYEMNHEAAHRYIQYTRKIQEKS